MTPSTIATTATMTIARLGSNCSPPSLEPALRFPSRPSYQKAPLPGVQGRRLPEVKGGRLGPMVVGGGAPSGPPLTEGQPLVS